METLYLLLKYSKSVRIKKKKKRSRAKKMKEKRPSRAIFWGGRGWPLIHPNPTKKATQKRHEPCLFFFPMFHVNVSCQILWAVPSLRSFISLTRLTRALYRLSLNMRVHSIGHTHRSWWSTAATWEALQTSQMAVQRKTVAAPEIEEKNNEESCVYDGGNRAIHYKRPVIFKRKWIIDRHLIYLVSFSKEKTTRDEMNLKAQNF